MGLSRYQLERTDLTTIIEQGRRVEGDLYAENHRSMQTMGELLKARMFGSTEYAIGLRKRMTNYVQGGRSKSQVTGLAPPELDPHPEHGVLCDCQDCDEAVKRLLRDCGVLPKGGYHRLELVRERIEGRLRVATRYRKDESDV